jgi:hypothetical protein
LESRPANSKTKAELNVSVKTHRQLVQELNKHTAAKDKAIAAINMHPHSKINFIFNLTIAERITAGNYVPAIKGKGHTGTGHPRGHAKDKKEPVEHSLINKEKEWLIPVEEGTTDNFGNLLIMGNTYIPVILSISTETEENLPKFVNTLTGYEAANTPQFVMKTV